MRCDSGPHSAEEHLRHTDKSMAITTSVVAHSAQGGGVRSRSPPMPAWQRLRGGFARESSARGSEVVPGCRLGGGHRGRCGCSPTISWNWLAEVLSSAPTPVVRPYAGLHFPATSAPLLAGDIHAAAQRGERWVQASTLNLQAGHPSGTRRRHARQHRAPRRLQRSMRRSPSGAKNAVTRCRTASRRSSTMPTARR